MTDEEAQFIVEFVRCDDVTIDIPTLKAAVHAFNACLGKSEATAAFIKDQAYSEASRALRAMGHPQAADALWSEAERLSKRR